MPKSTSACGLPAVRMAWLTITTASPPRTISTSMFVASVNSPSTSSLMAKESWARRRTVVPSGKRPSGGVEIAAPSSAGPSRLTLSEGLEQAVPATTRTASSGATSSRGRRPGRGRGERSGSGEHGGPRWGKGHGTRTDWWRWVPATPGWTTRRQPALSRTRARGAAISLETPRVLPSVRVSRCEGVEESVGVHALGRTVHGQERDQVAGPTGELGDGPGAGDVHPRLAHHGADHQVGEAGRAEHEGVGQEVVEAAAVASEHDDAPCAERLGGVEGELEVGGVLVDGVAFDPGPACGQAVEGVGVQRVEVADEVADGQTRSQGVIGAGVGGDHGDVRGQRGQRGRGERGVERVAAGHDHDRRRADRRRADGTRVTLTSCGESRISGHGGPALGDREHRDA